jgi:phosphatidylglycerol:prolipoprotein diacylglycerol transferase
MYPILFSLGKIKIYSYGFMVALTLLLGIIWVGRAAEKRKLATFDQIIDFAFYVIIGGLLFAKILHIIIEFDLFIKEPKALFTGSAGSFFGGVIGGFLFGVYYTKKKKIPTWELADVIAQYIPLGHILGRVGCLLSGCCYGVPTDVPWALRCSPDHILRHPTQIYEMIGNLLIFIILWQIRKHAEEKGKTYFPGFIFWLYIGLYAINRTITEFTRESQIMAFGWLRTTQFFCFLTMIVVFPYIAYKFKNQKKMEKEVNASSSINS